MCVSGSRIASMSVLSSSVSWPSISKRTFFPQASARSRTTRGNLLSTLPIGCIRVFITLACNSVVSRLSRCTVPRKPLVLVRMRCTAESDCGPKPARPRASSACRAGRRRRECWRRHTFADLASEARDSAGSEKPSCFAGGWRDDGGRWLRNCERSAAGPIGSVDTLAAQRCEPALTGVGAERSLSPVSRKRSTSAISAE